jgi:MerR family mercuric resistance operon transcriptional regulator
VSMAPPKPATLPIGEVSRRTGVNIETIRYYERIKMLPAPLRTTSGRRVYGPTETRALAFIRRSRQLGFTLDEVRALLALSVANGQGACAEVREIAARHLAEVKTKIGDLKAMQEVLADAVRHCDAGETPGCPLIETLSRSAPPRDDVLTRTPAKTSLRTHS